jgi:SIR2-like domain/Putative ATP-dependent DNA helicase recG C-terminal
MDHNVTTIERLYSLISDPNTPDAIVLLGAGASLKSGIPLSGELVEIAARWAYCRSQGRSTEDPTVVRSDWMPWLHAHSWYRAESGPADNYSATIEHLLRPREDRKEFFLEVLRPGVPPSVGYERLADLLADGLVRTVLTTNFDEVLPDLCRSRNRPHHVEVIKTPADYTKLSTSPHYPQLIYTHGSVEHYTDKNLLEEVQHLEEGMVRRLVPLLRDHPLIVVGYRGAEPSVMRHLLLEQATEADNYRHGIYWCFLGSADPSGLHPLVHEFADAIGGNFQIVPIDGFDEMMGRIVKLQQRRPSKSDSSATRSQDGDVFSPPTSDMRPVDGASLDDVDWTRVGDHLIAYCRRMAIPVTIPVDRDWMVNRLVELDLAVHRNGSIGLTTAGCLLFYRRPHDLVSSAQVVLRLGGEQERIFEGNLWRQLEEVMDALGEVNRPFRLKGTVSDTVYPYHQLALKELVVNALVHRSYEEAKRVVVEVEPTHIRIVNPGGLVEDVVQRVGLPIQERIERGTRGVKGYRNPVIADLFYGAGAMDKAGSGLADVQTWVKENGGKVVFGPTEDNAAFDVVVYKRPEAVDEETGTAAPIGTTGRFTGNLLEIVQIPRSVWHSGTRVRRREEVFWEAEDSDAIPPFILHEQRLHSFSELADPDNPLIEHVDLHDLEELSLSEFAEGEDGERRLVQLLNQCLYDHLYARGLIVDKRRKRAHFPREESGPREVTYPARLRKATRTVAKPIISKSTQKVRYWEHRAMRFGFERYGDVWALQILPAYAFTVDGYRKFLTGPRVGPLATRRASRDYNQHVRSDLVFWSWVLSGGQDTFAFDAGAGAEVVLRSSLPSLEVRDLVLSPDVEEPDMDAQAREELRELEEELGALAEEADAEEDEEVYGTED